MRALPCVVALGTLLSLLACSDGTNGISDGCSTGGGGAAGSVTVGNNFFRSDRNGTCNPAIDTVAAGSTVTWDWTGTTSHSVRSQGTPSFTSSAVLTGEDQTHSFSFNTPGTYQYDCSVHASQMTGQIVVQ
jgi:plastocyanin